MALELSALPIVDLSREKAVSYTRYVLMEMLRAAVLSIFGILLRELARFVGGRDDAGLMEQQWQ